MSVEKANLNVPFDGLQKSAERLTAQKNNSEELTSEKVTKSNLKQKFVEIGTNILTSPIFPVAPQAELQGMQTREALYDQEQKVALMEKNAQKKMAELEAMAYVDDITVQDIKAGKEAINELEENGFYEVSRNPFNVKVEFGRSLLKIINPDREIGDKKIAEVFTTVNPDLLFSIEGAANNMNGGEVISQPKLVDTKEMMDVLISQLRTLDGTDAEKIEALQSSFIKLTSTEDGKIDGHKARSLFNTLVIFDSVPGYVKKSIDWPEVYDSGKLLTEYVRNEMGVSPQKVDIIKGVAEQESLQRIAELKGEEGQSEDADNAYKILSERLGIPQNDLREFIKKIPDQALLDYSTLVSAYHQLNTEKVKKTLKEDAGIAIPAAMSGAITTAGTLDTIWNGIKISPQPTEHTLTNTFVVGGLLLGGWIWGRWPLMRGETRANGWKKIFGVSESYNVPNNIWKYIKLRQTGTKYNPNTGEDRDQLKNRKRELNFQVNLNQDLLDQTSGVLNELNKNNKNALDDKIAELDLRVTVGPIDHPRNIGKLEAAGLITHAQGDILRKYNRVNKDYINALAVLKQHFEKIKPQYDSLKNTDFMAAIEVVRTVNKLYKEVWVDSRDSRAEIDNRLKVVEAKDGQVGLDDGAAVFAYGLPGGAGRLYFGGINDVNNFPWKDWFGKIPLVGKFINEKTPSGDIIAKGGAIVSVVLEIGNSFFHWNFVPWQSVHGDGLLKENFGILYDNYLTHITGPHALGTNAIHEGVRLSTEFISNNVKSIPGSGTKPGGSGGLKPVDRSGNPLPTLAPDEGPGKITR